MTDGPSESPSPRPVAAGQPDPGALRSAGKDIGRAFGWWAIAFGVLANGVLGYLRSRYSDELSLAQTLWLTLPLAAAVAIIAYRVFAKQPLTLTAIFATVVGTLAASVVTGLSSGDRVANAIFNPHVDPACLSTASCAATSSAGDNPPELFVKIIAAYLRIYHGTGVLEAVASGIFIGYGAYRLSRRTPSTRV